MISYLFPDSEFVYKDSHGGVTLYNAENLTTKILMTNSTFVSIYHYYGSISFLINQS